MSNIIKFADLKIKAGKLSDCAHLNLILDKHQGFIQCEDCDLFIDPFNAFLILINKWDAFRKTLDRKHDHLDQKRETLEKEIHTLAALNLEKEWQLKTMLPACPSCQRGLLPSDFQSGSIFKANKEMEIARRKRETNHDK